ncbi:anaphase-promoting complex subunit Cdc27p [[Candida] railenensis]|uniref:Anaphase-promoting complex subunit Cdc27p n=1 Tax=[Candida] railenensis TaxID=45579 RepID=A0A9P0QV22_9ASCO|nr:anaphase-promoting complex subunit Cdc27p [[Candida] railenensis]
MNVPDQSFLFQHLRSIVLHSLDNFNYNNAEFACERLLALDPGNLDSIYLYCLTLLKKKRYKACFNYLVDKSDHLGCNYLFGRSCLHLKKYKEGIYKLLRMEPVFSECSYFSSSESKLNYENSRHVGPDSSSVYHLLGDLYSGCGDVKNSALSFSQCLKYNQFDFEAFQKLTKLGVNVRVKALYKFQEQQSSFGIDREVISSGNVKANTDKVITGGGLGGVGGSISNPFSATPPSQPPTIHADDSFISTPRAPKQTSFLDAPLRRSSHFDNNNLPQSNSRLDIFTKPSFPIDSITKNKRDTSFSKITSRLTSKDNGIAGSTSNNNNNSSNSSSHTNSMGGGGVSGSSGTENTSTSRSHLKRNNSSSMDPSAGPFSAQVGGISGVNTFTGSHNVGGITGGTVANGGNNGSTPPVVIRRRIENSERYLLSLYIIFAKGFKSFAKYDCYKSIRIFESLPENERETPWVLSKLGRLHYEIVNYKQSEYFFTKLRQMDRTRLEDMEYYSTLLWHLHKKVELTYLANELYDLDAEHAITWCVIGNLFSLAREPDEAIKCFSKSVKLDDSFTYAYTLKGHEYFSNDNYEMALENFRVSLLNDPRHYNALYGIGMVYINLGDYQKADYHFRKAVSINPINIILICCVGMVLEKIGKKSLALKQYELANKLQPLNPLPIFKKAQLLFSMQQFTQALKFFEILKDMAPDEASVHFLLGQLYKIHNEKFKAIREFTIALNLDPKGNYLIREAMESLKN